MQSLVVKAQSPASSTAITSVYIVRPKPPAQPNGRRGRAGAARMRNGDFKAGEVIPGTRYRVLGLLGVGGMGSVYEVEHIELGKRFVLKALLSDLAQREDLVARVRNEQRALGRLEHPCIVAVTDAGTTSLDIPYFVMERLDGETLSARLKRGGCLSLPDALTLAAGVLEGLSAAHHIGVIHRDIKPQNIFIAAGLRPKILDFGVAKVADVSGAITARGVAVGTPRYMSPEQASGEDVDGRSDIYAVGLLLFECLTGHGPFDDARDANEMLLAHLSRPVPRLLERVPGMTPELDAFIAQLLAKTRDTRPSTAAGAAVALHALRARLSHAPVPVQQSTVRIAAGAAVAPQATTRIDGIAGRRAAHAGVTEDALTLERVARPHDDRWAVTDRTASARTRTEVLPVAVRGSDLVTHTRVPVTPTDSSRTLDLAPVAGTVPPGGVQAKRAALWLFATAVGVSAGVIWYSPRLPGVRDEPPRAARGVRAAPATPATPATRVGSLVPAVAASASASRPEPTPARVPAATVKQRRAAPRASASAQKAENPALEPPLPAGLPSSGL
jgi:hypothetical protein